MTAMLLKAGYTVTELQQAGISQHYLKAAGYIPPKHSSNHSTDITHQLTNMKMLKAAGYTVSELKEAGISEDKLLAAGYIPHHASNVTDPTAMWLHKSNLTTTFMTAMLLKAGYTVTELQQAGISQHYLKAKGYIPTGKSNVHVKCLLSRASY
jgi:ribosomal protein L13E